MFWRTVRLKYVPQTPESERTFFFFVMILKAHVCCQVGSDGSFPGISDVCIKYERGTKAFWVQTLLCVRSSFVLRAYETTVVKKEQRFLQLLHTFPWMPWVPVFLHGFLCYLVPTKAVVSKNSTKTWKIQIKWNN